VTGHLTTQIRDLFPKHLQVPAKYWFGAARRALEPEMSLLGRLVGEKHHVIDVGGNRGVYAYKLWKLGCVVEVFEPNPICCAVLDAWRKGKPRVQLHPVALSATSGTASLHVPVDPEGVEHDASASLEDQHFAASRDHRVATATLDSYGFEDVAFIKIDVEGHETSVLAGAERTLAQCRPALLVEIEQRHNRQCISDVFRLIEINGYRGYFLHHGVLHSLRDFDPKVDQAASNFGVPGGRYINNFLFLHQFEIDSGRYTALGIPTP
jgi:FkbM family methyltransferase